MRWGVSRVLRRGWGGDPGTTGACQLVTQSQRRTFLGSVLLTFMVAVPSAVFVELGVLSVTDSDALWDNGAGFAVGVVSLVIVWLGRKPLLMVVSAGVVVAATSSVWLVALESTSTKLVTGFIIGTATAALYLVLSRLFNKYPSYSGVVLTGVGFLAVSLVDFPRVVRESEAPQWIDVGLLAALITAATIVTIDGLGDERGRLRTPGFVVLGVWSVLGLLGLFL